MEIYDGLLVHMVHNQTIYALYAQEFTPKMNVFRNYKIKGAADITIGRTPQNDICYMNALTSRNHAVLSYLEDMGWEIRDNGSTNGTFINGRYVQESSLNIGDVIYIMGLRIVIGCGFLSVNQNAMIKGEKLTRMSGETEGKTQGKIGSEEEEQIIFFNRYPRKRIPVNPKEITIEGPPMMMSKDRMPMLLRMGSSMVMGGTALMMGHVSMLLTSLMFPFLRQRYSDKEIKEYEKLRQEKYSEYLRQKEYEIEKEQKREAQLLNLNYPEFNDVLHFTEDEKLLWNRRKTDDDFLFLRVGHGKLPILADISYPERKFDLDNDDLEDKMYQIAEKEYLLKNVPITISLKEDNVCGILGDRELELQFLDRLIIQMSILYSSDEMKLIFLSSEKELNRFKYVRYLPHIWDDQRTIRFLATSSMETAQISEYLKNEFEDVLSGENAGRHEKRHPYYVVIALHKKIFYSVEIFKDIMEMDKNVGISFVTVFDDLPKETTKIFNMRKNGYHSIVHLKEIDKEDIVFQMDSYDPSLAMTNIRTVMNTNLKMISEEYALPKAVAFLEMYGVGKIEHLNPLKRWKENNPINSLAAPIGIATDGSLFELDLHEKYQGPHGLVAGTTGSGKSEFLITYILSLAVNYHPDEVAFVLIDYKGGGLAGAFDNKQHNIHLPHLRGTITNLDGSAIHRSLKAIESEMTRRQCVFGETCQKLKEGTMNIYLYQRLYRNKQVKEPMPHLFIISDEFAELKQQQPEFMDKLISIARIGRSLGVHLILATQKPSGVVNDQIRSNAKFKVCLKVQDRYDSQDMLMRTEAADIKETGRFYLQVGNNEFFALGQSAWSGAPYEPQDTVLIQKDDTVCVLDHNGQNIYEAKPDIKKGKEQGTQLIAIVSMISDLAEKGGFVEKSLWKPELPKLLDSGFYDNEIKTNDKSVIVPIGIIDDPEGQAQYPYILDLVKCRHLLIAGDAGSGKTTLLQNILYQLVKRYSSEKVQFYILDYSSRMLQMFKELPHCGEVHMEEDINNLDKFFGLIHDIIEERKNLFSELEVDGYEMANEVCPIPLILVVIDNISLWKMTKEGEDYYYGLQNYLRGSLRYGIRYLISCVNVNDIISSARSDIGDRICLHLKDKYEYWDVLEENVDYEPTECVGRGMCIWDEKTLEWQAAIYEPDLEDQKRLQKLKQEINQLKERYRENKKAKSLPKISETITYEEFFEQFSNGRIPLGYSLADTKEVALPMKQFSLISLYFGNPAGELPIFKNFLYASEHEKMEVWFVKKVENSVFIEENFNEREKYLDNAKIYEIEKESVGRLWNDIANEMLERWKEIIKFIDSHGINHEREDLYDQIFPYLKDNTIPILLVIENLADFCIAVEQAEPTYFGEIFRLAQQRNVHVIAGFKADDFGKASKNQLFSQFYRDADAMLFGGCYSGQEICSISLNDDQKKRMLPYNICIMKYKDNQYSLLMPCGEIEVVDEKINRDDRNIFE